MNKKKVLPYLWLASFILVISSIKKLLIPEFDQSTGNEAGNFANLPFHTGNKTKIYGT
jgi:hypothetical protein